MTRGEKGGTIIFMHCWCHYKLASLFWKTTWVIKINMSFDSVILFLGIDPKKTTEMKAKAIGTDHIHCSIFSKYKQWEVDTYKKIRKQIMVGRFSMKYYAVVKSPERDWTQNAVQGLHDFLCVPFGRRGTWNYSLSFLNTL